MPNLQPQVNPSQLHTHVPKLPGHPQPIVFYCSLKQGLKIHCDSSGSAEGGVVGQVLPLRFLSFHQAGPADEGMVRDTRSPHPISSRMVLLSTGCCPCLKVQQCRVGYFR